MRRHSWRPAELSALFQPAGGTERRLRGVNCGVNDHTRQAQRDASPSGELDREFDWAWARGASTHELSAHGRSVQRRLDTPAPTTPRPSLWKRMRFALYRLSNGR